MPLPDLLPNNTARFKLFYTTCVQQHTMVVRSSPVSPAAFGTAILALYGALAASVYTTSFDEVQFAAAGSDVFNAVTTGIEGTVHTGFGLGTRPQTGQYFNFVGRSPAGYRVRAAVFGAIAIGSDFRYIPGESAALDAAQNVVSGTTGLWLAIDGQAAVWKGYINAGYNAYWQRAVRP